MTWKIPLLALAALSLTACTDAVGEWSGVCDIGEFEIDVDVSMSEEDGIITGDGVFSYTTREGDTFAEDVTVTGTRDGAAVEIELQPDSAGEMEISGTLDGDTLEGGCMWATIEGDALLTR